MVDLVELGSATAKSGFQNEREMCKKFENWKEDLEAVNWLKVMGHDPTEITHVSTKNLPPGYKADIQIIINKGFKIYTENLSLKRTKEGANFNQIDKRWVDSYKEMWGLNKKITTALKMFTGEIRPQSLLDSGIISKNLFDALKDKRRFFLNEMTGDLREEIFNFFKNNKDGIISDLLKGRGEFAADWMLVTKYNLDKDTVDWVIRDIDSALRIFGSGGIKLSPQGSLYIGRVFMQRKGGDGGRPTANMLQFKASPIDLFRF